MISARGISPPAGVARAAARRVRVYSKQPPADGAAGAPRSMWRRLRLSHRLERAVELYVDQHGGARVLERRREKIGRLVHGPRAIGLYPERASKPHEIDLRIRELHSDIVVGLFRQTAHAVQALLENAVGGVVQDDEYGADAVMRRGPQPLTGIHGAAVADECYDGPVGQ